jgi:ubiquitin-conjugating enzyme E2 Q
VAEDDDDSDVIPDTDSNDSDTDKSGDTSGYDLATEDTSVPFAEIGYRSRGFLHALAEDARKACELAQAKAVSEEASESGNDVWTWCCVSSIPMHLRVQVQFELAGIIDKRMAASLGISLDEPVTLALEFSKLLWSDSIFSVSKPFSPERMSATQENKSSSAMPEENNTILDVEARKLRGCDHKCYGLEVLFPELTRTFFEGLNWRKAGGPEDLVSCQHCILTEKTSSLFEQLVSCVSHPNPFLGLLDFILKRLASLPNWCIVCWDSLPVSVTRLCTCDKDIWYVAALDDSLSNCFVHFSSEYCPLLQIFA